MAEHALTIGQSDGFRYIGIKSPLRKTEVFKLRDYMDENDIPASVWGDSDRSAAYTEICVNALLYEPRSGLDEGSTDATLALAQDLADIIQGQFERTVSLDLNVRVLGGKDVNLTD